MATIIVPSGHTHPPGWPPEPIPPVGYLSRKALPIKRNDAEPLTREDVQYDLLYHIFADKTGVFHSPIPGKMCSFRDLYIHALYNSNKCSKVLKDKMVDTPAFGVELAKISLLTNVGRINTTMAFFPEMKTALRTYHPVPSLQKTDGNAQDAPRIKNCLKAALLPSEFKSVPPSTPEEILKKTRSGQYPPTSVVNLIFVLSNHAAPLANIHFDGTLNFLDLFLPKPLSSQDRARVFLWLMYYYLENPDGQNPFDDPYSRMNPGKAPQVRKLTKDEEAKENVDTLEEREWGALMSSQRNAFLSRLVLAASEERKSKSAAPHFVTAPPESRRPRSYIAEIPKEEAAFMYYVPNHDVPFREQDRSSSHNQRSNRASPVQERSMLEQAWHTVMTYDPLLDSDEESQDENVRIEYTRRLSVITRLRGRPPTPEPSFEDAPLGRFQQVQSWD
ncbi:hypothetical protein DFH08DRAFT_851003 [Mycena albidolilacea]|uniref:Ino eighty subunit 1 n=1 Tax=Mycena albidolilacea TaxID=1033008 RepID=A0AAD7EXW5_9AGAR|nr:hypothetical protein DFH08DRAFT_851003 [Mycena albidolilacea]